MNNNLTGEIHSTVKLTPLKITLIYMLVGLFYILLSDQLLAVFVENLTTVFYLETIKGCFYVLVTGLMLYALIGRGFSELYRSEERLRKSEKRFRDLVENLLTGISIIQDGQIVYQNQEQETF
jgi:PAS domain-containing protein